MANPNAFSSYPARLGLIDDDPMDHQFLSFNNNLGQNHVNESNMIGSHLVLSNPPLRFSRIAKVLKKILQGNQEKKRAAESELVSRRNQEKKPAAESEVKVADVKIDRSSKVGDGRTHRLPHNKYGPYTCPRNRGRKKSDEKDEKQGDGQCIISPEAPGNFLLNVTDKMQGDGQYIINPEAPSNSLVDCFDMKQGDEECVISPEAPRTISLIS
ncbi:hypothetical protein GH714_011961 [Hevea brasiliensis]|uniref:Uncharacterized protein n=1 Tax=Hevea brasiliensis TaxID=3981 RepID=A0A6A6KE76_HEVBR|nr:hypothetical protein GH714_011961 [Hevea brasiliensis]